MMNDNKMDNKTVQEKLNIHYEIVEVDLTKARNLEDMDIHPYKVEHYNELTVMYTPSAIDLILNKKTNDAIPVQANQTITISWFKIKELYITNEAGTGTAIIWLASRLE